jgi:hypothetical protein
MGTVPSFFLTIPWFGWLAITGTVFGCLVPVVAIITKHRERMGMIRMGIHPDAEVEKPSYEERGVSSY